MAIIEANKAGKLLFVTKFWEINPNHTFYFRNISPFYSNSIYFYNTIHGSQHLNYQNDVINTCTKYVRMHRNIIKYMNKYTVFHL